MSPNHKFPKYGYFTIRERAANKFNNEKMKVGMYLYNTHVICRDNTERNHFV